MSVLKLLMWSLRPLSVDGGQGGGGAPAGGDGKGGDSAAGGDKGGDKGGQGGNGDGKGGAAPAAPSMTQEEIDALKASEARWNAVKGMYREKEDGTLELDPSFLPPPPQRTDEDPDVKAQREAEVARKREIEDTAARTSAAYSQRVSDDLSLQQKLQKELSVEPGGEDIFEAARNVMQKVPIESRTEKAWRNALTLGRGATESKRREHWINEGRKKAEEEISKIHGIRIPRGNATPALTEDEMVDNLTDEQKRYCERTNTDKKVYAKRLAELKGGR